MSRTSRFLGGLSLGYLHLVAVTLTGLWLTPFLLGHLGQHALGLWLLAGQILGYLALLDFGVLAMLPRETAYLSERSEGADAALRDLLAQVRSIVWVQAPIVALTGAVVWIALPGEWRDLSGPLALVLATVAVTFPWRIHQAVLQGLQDLAFGGRVQLLTWTAGTLVTVGLVLRGAGLYALAAGWITTQVLATAATVARLRLHFSHVWSPNALRWQWATAREYLSRSGWVSLAQIAQVLLTGTDVLVLGKLLGAAAVVPYACTGKLVSVLANHPQMLMHAAAPGLSQMRASESRERLFEVSSALTQAMLMASGAVACLVLAVNRSFVGWWIGLDQYGGPVLGAAIVLAMLLRHWNVTTVYTLFCFGHERRLSLTALAEGAVALVSGAVLVRILGPIGAPLGLMVGVVTVSLPWNLGALARELDVPATRLVARLHSWGARCTVAAIVAVLISWSPVASPTFAGVAVTAVASLAVYTALMLPLLMRDPLAGYVRRVLGLLGRWTGTGRAVLHRT